MANSLVYRIPEGRERIVPEIVNAIPSDWSYMDGKLVAPVVLVGDERVAGVAEKTDLHLSKWDVPTFRGRVVVVRDGDKLVRSYQPPNLIGVLFDQKLPSRVIFDKVGSGTCYPTLADAREIAKRFIMKGYTCYLRAYNSNDESGGFLERISIWQEGRKVLLRNSPTGPEYENLPPNVEIDWNPRCGGKREHLDRLVYFLEKALGLEEMSLAPV